MRVFKFRQGRAGRGCIIALSSILSAPTPSLLAVELEYGALLEIDWTRSTLRQSEQRSTAADWSAGTLAMSLSAAFGPHWGADLVLLAEDIGVTDHNDYLPADGAEDKRPDRLHVDELTFGYTSENFDAAVGRMTLPFGRFETALLSDPQTLEIGETQTEFGAHAVYRTGDVHFGAAAFNGNLRSIAPDRAGYAAYAGWEIEPLQLTLGYLSAQHAGKDAPALVDLAAALHTGVWFVGAEWVGAPHTGRGQQPRALHVEVGREFGSVWGAGLRYQQTSRFEVLDEGSGRFREWAVGLNRELFELVHLGVEYAVGDEDGPRQHLTLVRLTVEY